MFEDNLEIFDILVTENAVQTGWDCVVETEQVPALVATLSLLQLHFQAVDLLPVRVLQVAVLNSEVKTGRESVSEHLRVLLV